MKAQPLLDDITNNAALAATLLFEHHRLSRPRGIHRIEATERELPKKCCLPGKEPAYFASCTDTLMNALADLVEPETQHLDDYMYFECLNAGNGAGHQSKNFYFCLEEQSHIPEEMIEDNCKIWVDFTNAASDQLDNVLEIRTKERQNTPKRGRNNSLNQHYIEALHRSCMPHLDLSLQRVCLSKRVTETDLIYVTSLQNCSGKIDAIRSHLQSSCKQLNEVLGLPSGSHYFVIEKNGHTSITVKKQYKYIVPPRIDAIEVITGRYEDQVSKFDAGTTADERLEVIAEFIQFLELAHPFHDGNCRTFCGVLLQAELARHGFSPSAVRDINLFDALPTEDLVGMMKKGQIAYQELSSKPIITLDLSLPLSGEVKSRSRILNIHQLRQQFRQLQPDSSKHTAHTKQTRTAKNSLFNFGTYLAYGMNGKPEEDDSKRPGP